MSEQHGTDIGPRRSGRLIARIGAAGFLFFLIKGLLWLIVPAALAGAIM